MRERWADDVTAAAHAYWTPERTRTIVGDKRLEVMPAEAPVLLRAVGLLHRDATMPPRQVRKFLQVNHLVRALRVQVRELIDRGEVVRVLDAGCGRSYLSLLLAYCARDRWGGRLQVLGVDRQADVIAECRRRAEIAQLDDVARYEAAELGAVDVEAAWERAYGERARPSVVIALHACDTATCDAIALAVELAAELVAVAPCCQAELGRRWTELAEANAAGAFAPIWRAPHLRRELAAHVTDAMRVLLMRAAGYAATPLELVASEHTRKNTLVRATRGAPDPDAWAEYEALVGATGGVGLALAGRIRR